MRRLTLIFLTLICAGCSDAPRGHAETNAPETEATRPRALEPGPAKKIEMH